MHIISYIFHIYVAIIFRYFTVPVISNYTHANDLCNYVGGILASITSEFENIKAIARCQNGISENVWSGCWIGLNKRNGYWEYIDGTDKRGLIGFDSIGDPITGQHPWDTNEPNNNNNNEGCIHLRRTKNYKWNDIECSFDHYIEDDIPFTLNIPLCVKNPPKSCGININNLKVWYKGGLNDISNNGNDAINVKGNIYNDVSDCTVYGDVDSSFIIPYNINTTSHTIIYVAKYNGYNKNRILTSRNDTDYLTGFYNRNEGVCYQGNWITQQNTGLNNDWIIMTSYPNGCRANGTDVHNDNSQAWTVNSNPGTFNIGVNIFNKNECSDWKMYELLIFDLILSEYQMECIEQYLSQEHTIPIQTYTPILSINPTKTCPPSIINSQAPSNIPTSNPTKYPSNIPTLSPTQYPSKTHTITPTVIPTVSSQLPSNTPTHFPTSIATDIPTHIPTKSPSISPFKSSQITMNPSNSNTLSLQFIILGLISIGCCYCTFTCCFIGFIIYSKKSNVLKSFIKHGTFSSDNEQPSSINNEPESIKSYPKEGHIINVISSDDEKSTNYGDI